MILQWVDLPGMTFQWVGPTGDPAALGRAAEGGSVPVVLGPPGQPGPPGPKGNDGDAVIEDPGQIFTLALEAAMT